MHGSGDVLPHQVNPDTSRLISELTVGYIRNLVDAALDAQVLLAGGPSNVTPPPPLYPRSRQPPMPAPPFSSFHTKQGDDYLYDGNSKTGLWKKRPRRPDVEWWDEPLPEPKIIKRAQTTVTGNGTEANQSSSLFFAVVYMNNPQAQGDDEKEYALLEDSSCRLSSRTMVHVDHWVGAAGVDLFEASRSRVALVRMPEAIGVQCFIFPICYDGFLYGKVVQVQASRRAIVPVLVNKTLLDLVQKEGALATRHVPRRKKRKKQGLSSKKSKVEDKDALSGDADLMEDEPEQEEEDEEDEPRDDGPTWPGLEFLLPVHALTDTLGTET